MRQPLRVLALALVATGILVFPLAAGAGHENDPRTPNLKPMGHIFEPASLLNPAIGNPDVHTDIAFWGKFAIQGNWDGFNIRNIAAPGNPKQVGRAFCNGDQGDVVVWKNLVVRSWNSNAPGTTFCGGELVPAGFEGLHIFDISDKRNPELVGSVDLPCGSHTASGIPDPKNGRLLIYNGNSGVACPWIDIVEVPLDDPGSASLIRNEPSDHTCHDIGIILGKAMRAACAGGEGVRVFSLGGPDGGTLEDPELLYHIEEEGVTIGHSAAWTWDGKVLIFGHEPGGGVAAQCEATDPEFFYTYFFYDGDTGEPVGEWTLPRPQSSTENCTLHNLNVVPLKKRYVLVHGSYQSGTSVVDFTDPANAEELAWSDPPPIVPPDLGGAWSSYWYNNFIYETNITEGLNIFRFTGRETAGALRLSHLNPQTQEFTIDDRKKGKKGKRD
ncbi:MAG: LVIVD repeat-containing protein [Gaiellaceae bacterium]